MTETVDQQAAVERLRTIATQLRELETRLATTASADVEVSLLERAGELADEAAGLLEQVSRAAP